MAQSGGGAGGGGGRKVNSILTKKNLRQRRVDSGEKQITFVLRFTTDCF
jgi:hypothetical protein